MCVCVCTAECYVCVYCRAMCVFVYCRVLCVYVLPRTVCAVESYACVYYQELLPRATAESYACIAELCVCLAREKLTHFIVFARTLRLGFFIFFPPFFLASSDLLFPRACGLSLNMCVCASQTYSSEIKLVAFESPLN